MVRRLLILTLAVCTTTAFSTPQITATSIPQAKILYTVDTSDKVVFITADDGIDKPQDAATVLERLQWPITSFILPTQVGSFAPWFSSLGSRNDIASHTEHHLALKGMSFDRQKKEICQGQRRISEEFGSTTRYFRPPYGSWDKTTLQAAAACGISHVVLWTVSLNGRTITTWDGNIHPGNIVLVHYVRSMGQSLRTIEKKLASLNLKVARLSDYLK